MNSPFEELAAPFAANEIEWRAGPVDNKENPTKTLAMAYMDARAVMNRLDAVMGPGGWTNSYRAGPAGGVICSIALRIGDEWIAKEDGGENSDIEPVKGGLSDAFKRAAVCWGIGRYLYDVPSVWVDCKKAGNSVRITGTPQLPSWALPAGAQTQAQRGGMPATSPPVSPPAAAVDTRTGEIVAKPAWYDEFVAWRRDNNVKPEEIAALTGAFTVPNIEAWIAGGATRSIDSLKAAILSARRVPA